MSDPRPTPASTEHAQPAAATTAIMQPEDTVEDAPLQHAFPSPAVMVGGFGMPARLSLIQRMKLGAASLLGF